ncbi:hypothetical protein MVES_001934 [Malassezia vespertilionis]|uniref:Uncharacterized protein n=1 Tax=Malassezia vespertilionis TaxID=2020962 RepID=A0A2N1JBV8_9BASI|nr:hypothetical protein MVES_001934 [Malassezia vespertilionis]
MSANEKVETVHSMNKGISASHSSIPTETFASLENESESQEYFAREDSNGRDHEKGDTYTMKDEEAGDSRERGGNRKFEVRTREHWYQFWRYKNPPAPPPASFDDATVTPLAQANILSDWTYEWIRPLLLLGYRRPLEASDLWKMDGPRQAETLSDRLTEAWDKRVAKADAYNVKLASGEIKPGWRQKRKWKKQAKIERNESIGGDASIQERVAAKESIWRIEPVKEIQSKKLDPDSQRRILLAHEVKSGQKKASVFMALFDIFWPNITVAYFAKLLADTAYVGSALLIEQILTGIGMTEAGINRRGHSIGYTVVMFAILVLSNFLSNRFFYESLYVGVFSRAALSTTVFRRALNMQGRDRSTGKLVNHISTDVSRIDFGAQWWLLTFTAPVEIIVCLVILLTRFGVSCLSGFALVVVVLPFQIYCLKFLFSIRKKSMEWTDRRARRTQEVLSGMRIVKLFSYEFNFVKLISSLRKSELIYVFKLNIVRAGVMASAISLPLLAGVLAVVTYYLKEGTLRPEKVFPAITLFQLLRLPLMFFPFGISVIADGANAFQRLGEVFYAKQYDTTVNTDENSPYGLELQNTSFEWDSVEEDLTLTNPKAKKQAKKEKKQRVKQASKNKRLWAILRPKTQSDEKKKKRRFSFMKKSKKESEKVLEHISVERELESELPPVAAVPEAEDPLSKDVLLETEGDAGLADFIMKDVSLKVKRGNLCAIIGPVGSGKSSLILGAIGEMRRLAGEVTWGSPKIAYCSQSAWIQNATVRENIVFGQPWDEARYWDCIDRAELSADFVLLQNGDLTEIGERGVTLSGGQKQRVNIARALYYDAEIVCLDDPLSAVDAHVGKALFSKAILPLRKSGKTVLLVTHAIQYLPQMDQIVSMDEGVIDECGTYQELMENRASFYNTMVKFGNLKEEHGDAVEADAEELAAETEDANQAASKPRRDEMSKPGAKTMELEERNTGTVDSFVYRSYLRAGQASWILPIAVVAAVCMQGSVNISSYWLVWWRDWDRDGTHGIGFSVGLYVMFGLLQLIFNFILDIFLGLLTFFASRKLHDMAMERVIYAPMTWFDTTPLGRIMNRFGKDIDVMDNQLSNLLRQCASTIMSIVGAAAMVIALTYYFTIVVVFVFGIAWLVSLFYRSSAREFKRIDAMLRSSFYSHFAESLTGLTTIRAYQESRRFLLENYKRMDDQNRAYFLTIVNQRWLGLRLDFLGSFCVLITGILVSCGVGSGTNSATSGVALSMIVTIAQTLGFLTRQLTELENEMNSAERLVYYAETLPQEKAQQITETKPPQSWPAEGNVVMENLWLKYRPNLPFVLKGVDLDVKGGQKIGIVVLLRISELTEGRICIDGVDVSTIGLEDLRRAIAILPQEPLLFSGTLRSNLDPFDVYDDSRLWDAMQRSYLSSSVQSPDAGEAVLKNADTEAQGTETKALTHLTLESIVDEEGANLSVGQRSLVSLARALVKNSKIILLDEATASVDLATDAKIQHTIRTEFSDRTLLCIAHRLSTIIGYDRIVVMDDGKVVEFDAPLALFNQPDSIFRGMCQRSGITAEEIASATL